MVDKVKKLMSDSNAKNGRKTRTSLYIDADLYLMFRKICSSRDLSVSQVFDAFLRDFVDTYSEKEGKDGPKES